MTAEKQGLASKSLSLETEKDDLEAQLESVQEEKTSMSADNAHLRVTIDYLKTSMAEMEQKLSKRKRELKDVKAKLDKSEKYFCQFLAAGRPSRGQRKTGDHRMSTPEHQPVQPEEDIVNRKPEPKQQDSGLALLEESLKPGIISGESSLDFSFLDSPTEDMKSSTADYFPKAVPIGDDDNSLSDSSGNLSSLGDVVSVVEDSVYEIQHEPDVEQSSLLSTESLSGDSLTDESGSLQHPGNPVHGDQVSGEVSSVPTTLGELPFSIEEKHNSDISFEQPKVCKPSDQLVTGTVRHKARQSKGRPTYLIQDWEKLNVQYTATAQGQYYVKVTINNQVTCFVPTPFYNYVERKKRLHRLALKSRDAHIKELEESVDHVAVMLQEISEMFRPTLFEIDRLLRPLSAFSYHSEKWCKVFAACLKIPHTTGRCNVLDVFKEWLTNQCDKPAHYKNLIRYFEDSGCPDLECIANWLKARLGDCVMGERLACLQQDGRDVYVEFVCGPNQKSPSDKIKINDHPIPHGVGEMPPSLPLPVPESSFRETMKSIQSYIE